VILSHPTRAAERSIAPHPSLKPQSFMRQIVRAVLPVGEGVVLDTFAGAGSTLAAAEALGYQSIGTERDSNYFEVATTAIPLLSQLSSNGRAISREASLFPHDAASPSESQVHPWDSSENPLFALAPNTRR